MKAALYFTYPLRNLVRGGWRTLLAILSIAIGIMGLVTLQLVGVMAGSALAVNVRDANGGDLLLTTVQPLHTSDLSYFDTLKENATIVNYTPAVELAGMTSLHNSGNVTFFIQFIDPGNFPLVTPPTIVAPAQSSLKDLLTGNQVVANKAFVDQYHLKVGDTFTMHTGAFVHYSQAFQVKLAGIVTGTLSLSSERGLVLASLDEYKAMNVSAMPLMYDRVYMTTTDAAHTTQAINLLQNRFPYTELWTPQESLRQQINQIETVKTNLALAGLLALLLGCAGLVSTLRVSLARRETDIATLKAIGYRRRDISLLLGMETGITGLLGGVLGAGLAIGVSYLISGMIAQILQITLAFTLNLPVLGGGILVGLVVALIFGLLPIIQRVAIQPGDVLRNLPETRTSGRSLFKTGLALVLPLLLCGLAILVLNRHFLLGVEVIYGVLIGLGVLSLLCAAGLWLLNKLPFPKRLLRGSQMAWWNIGRQRGHTITTMVVLFISIFTIGLTMQLEQSLHSEYSSPRFLHFNVVAVTSGNETNQLQVGLNSLPGLSGSLHTTITPTVPLTVNGVSFTSLWKGSTSALSGSPYDATLDLLGGVEGFDIANQQYPDPKSFQIRGRDLNASDVGTNNALVDARLADPGLGAAQLHLGDQVTLENANNSSQRTLTIVGFFRPIGSAYRWFPVLTSSETVKALQPEHIDQSVFYMSIDPQKVSQAIDAIGTIVPNVYLQDESIDNQASYQQSANQVFAVLMVFAWLVQLVAACIVANEIALSLFKRRRELGILKALGYTSRSILRQILIENGIISGISAVLASILVIVATIFLSISVMQIHVSISPLLIVALVVGAILLVMGITTLAARGAAHAHPLEVLRYE